MRVYLDEAGDLGFKFSEAFRFGGSSRYLTIAFLLSPKSHTKYTKRFTKSFKKTLGLARTDELKGKNLTDDQLVDFAVGARQLLQQHSQCALRAITVKKRNVQAHIQQDPNKLYNYMIKLCLLNQIQASKEVLLIPDPRTIKLKSGNSLVHYLQIALWFDLGVTTQLVHNPVESHNSLNLQFIDVISHIVWDTHEWRKTRPFRQLSPSIACSNLFF